MNKLLVQLIVLNLLVFTNTTGITAEKKGTHYSDLGRLFTTAMQRAKIEQLKLLSHKQIKAYSSRDVARPRAISHKQSIKRISVHGIVKKNNGLVLTWIRQNGVLKHTRSHQNKDINPLLKDIFSIRFKLDNKPSLIEIKPGQTYLKAGNKVLDDWQINKNETPGKNKSAESAHVEKQVKK